MSKEKTPTPAKPKKASSKKKTGKKSAGVVEMPPPTMPDDQREFINAAIGLSEVIVPDKIVGYFIYCWSEDDEGSFMDCAAFNRGGMHPYLFPEVVKKALEKNM
jgi:hypothetical protein